MEGFYFYFIVKSFENKMELTSDINTKMIINIKKIIN